MEISVLFCHLFLRRHSIMVNFRNCSINSENKHISLLFQFFIFPTSFTLSTYWKKIWYYYYVRIKESNKKKISPLCSLSRYLEIFVWMCYKPQPCLKIFLWHNCLHSRSRTTDNIAIKCVRTQTGRTIAVAKWDTSFKGKTAEPALH